MLNVQEDAMEELRKMKWTGNIRELKNVAERLVILCDGSVSSEDIRRYANPLYE